MNAHARKPAPGDWQQRFGAKRRALDRAILLEAERAIAAEEASAGPGKPQEAPSSESAAETIARAFGRPWGPGGQQ